jgi:hypothetical protein
MTTLAALVPDKHHFLRFLKTRFQLCHLSNIFFRDVQYGLMAYVQESGSRLAYGRAEELAVELVKKLAAAGILRAIMPGSWMLNFDEFRKQSTKPDAAPRTTAPAGGAKTTNASLT